MNVVIATDGSPSSAAAVAWAAQFLDPGRSTVHVVAVAPFTALLVPRTPGLYLPDDTLDEVREAALSTARRALDDARATLAVAGEIHGSGAEARDEPAGRIRSHGVMALDLRV